MKVWKGLWGGLLSNLQLKVGPARIMALSTWVLEISKDREGVKKMEPGSSQRCPMTGQEATGTNSNTGGYV